MFDYMHPIRIIDQYDLLRYCIWWWWVERYVINTIIIYRTYFSWLLLHKYSSSHISLGNKHSLLIIILTFNIQPPIQLVQPYFVILQTYCTYFIIGTRYPLIMIVYLIYKVHYFIKALFVFGVCFHVAEHLCYLSYYLLLLIMRVIGLLYVAHLFCCFDK